MIALYRWYVYNICINKTSAQYMNFSWYSCNFVSVADIHTLKLYIGV